MLVVMACCRSSPTNSMILRMILDEYSRQSDLDDVTESAGNMLESAAELGALEAIDKLIRIMARKRLPEKGTHFITAGNFGTFYILKWQ